jgi:hypothetical protein
MAKLSQLVSCTSEVTGVPIATVREISRRLREANLIQTGKGGRYGGANMTPSDAASLLTALLIVKASSVSQSSIVSLTRSHLTSFRAHYPRTDHLLLGQWDQKLGLGELCKLKRGHTFGESFAALIAGISSGDFKRAVGDWASSRPRGTGPFFEVTVSITSPRPYPEAHIEFLAPAFDRLDLIYLRPPDARGAFMQEMPRKWADLSQGTYSFDLMVTAAVSEQALAPIALLLGEGGTDD